MKEKYLEENIIGNNICWWRNKRGLTQEDLSRKLRQKNIYTVSKWERGVRLPTIHSLLNIAEVLDCSPADLLED